MKITFVIRLPVCIIMMNLFCNQVEWLWNDQRHGQ